MTNAIAPAPAKTPEFFAYVRQAIDYQASLPGASRDAIIDNLIASERRHPRKTPEKRAEQEARIAAYEAARE